jgi:hypothetical protein
MTQDPVNTVRREYLLALKTRGNVINEIILRVIECLLAELVNGELSTGLEVLDGFLVLARADVASRDVGVPNIENCPAYTFFLQLINSNGFQESLLGVVPATVAGICVSDVVVRVGKLFVIFGEESFANLDAFAVEPISVDDSVSSSCDYAGRVE